jgi:DNA mismatch repair protein MutS2
MDAKSLEMLEFPRVREILAGFTSFSASRDLAMSLRPSADLELVSLLLTQSTEARRLLAANPGFSIGAASDVREAAEMAARGKILEPQTLVDIQMTLAAACRLHSNLAKASGEFPSLWGIAERIVLLPRLEENVARCIDAAGDLLDSASAKLADLRRQLKAKRQQLLDRLDGIIKSAKGQRVVQEPLITERGGRYVISVRTELQRELKGIVHDVSNTGATVFVEPWMTVDLGNERRQLAIEEQREVERILAALSADVGANRAAISENVALLAELDLALAKARYAERARATEPVIVGEIIGDCAGQMGTLRLIEARHPLLKGKAVPLSVEIGKDFSALIITGPNTGGKTVALKTIGLLTLMAQSGMPIPASENSCIPIFDGVFADIGDEQSIEQTLSTFSWHMGNIVRIIETSTPRSLVLLDELGISTDPNEGAALARAILLHFLSKRTFVVATTHFSDLKVFAHMTPGMQNASLEFDPVTLTPTYHLTLGIPGGSNALATALRLGLPAEIIASAREMLTTDSAEIEKLLTDLTSEKLRTRALHSDLEEEKARAADLRSRLEHELQRLREREQSMLRETRDRLAEEAARLYKDIRQASSEMKRARSKESIERAQEALNAAREQIQAWQTQSSDEGVRSIVVGDDVRLRGTSQRGTVVSLRDSQIEVHVGRSKVRMNIADVEEVKPSRGKVFASEDVHSAEPMIGGGIPRSRHPQMPTSRQESDDLHSANTLPESFTIRKPPRGKTRLLELDLRGKRAGEIERQLDSYLNDASLAGLTDGRIIHGFGSGTVRGIVREMLASHPLVRSFRPGGWGEGGDGVTIVVLQ